MANRKPIVINGGSLEQLQSGDGLVDADGHPFVDAENAFGTDDVLLAADGTERGAKATAIDKDDVVQAASGFVADDALILANGTGKSVKDSTIVEGDLTQAFADILTNAGDISTNAGDIATNAGDIATNAGDIATNAGDIDAIEADYVDAASAFGTDNAILTADGTGRGAQAGPATLEDNGHLAIARTENSGNISLGVDALASITTATNSTAIGDGALNDVTSGNGNVGIGFNAMPVATISGNNVAIGRQTLLNFDNPSTGGGNFAIGAASLLLLEEGVSNIAIGSNSMRSLLDGTNNVGVGSNAARTIVGSSGNLFGNTFVGGSAGFGGGQAAEVENSTGIGANAYTTASNQVMIGDSDVTQTLLRGVTDVVRETNPCRLNVYNTSATDVPDDDFELLAMRWDSDVAKIGTHAGGSGGTVRDLEIEVGATTQIAVTASEVVATNGVGFFGETPPGSQPAHIDDAEETHSFGTGYDATELQNAMDALGEKINDILAVLEGYGMTAES